MISLVGIGPGIPGLLVLRGIEAIGQADVILWDVGVPSEVLALARKGARLVSAAADPEANARDLARWATGGGAVARLLVGDVLGSSRGAAEAHALHRLGASFEIIPGIARAVAEAADERGPLFGRRVVVTRPRAQAEEFVSWLEAQGAEAVEFPAIRIVAPPDPEPLARAAAMVGEYDWVVLTSVNGVERFWDALAAAGLDSRALGGARVAAIGPATAAALATHGVRPDVVPARYVAEAVVEAMTSAAKLEGARVLLPRAHGAREVLPVELRAQGATVTEVEAYRSIADADAAGELRPRLAGGQIDVVTFTSSSTVRSFVDALGTELGGAIVACIGPITAGAARTAGLPVQVVATDYTIPGLAAALRAYFERAAAGEGGEAL